MNKFKIRSRRWDIGVGLGAAVLVVLAVGGLVLLGEDAPGDASAALLFVAAGGLVALLFFSGPGIVYVARKRIPFLKKRLPGNSMTWIRAHLYLPVLAVLAAYLHATSTPFRSAITSGKITLAVACIVAIAGVARHRLIGLQKSAMNIDVEIQERLAGTSREFGRLVHRYREGELSADEAATIARSLPEGIDKWEEIRAMTKSVERYFPPGGGQRQPMRRLKLWRAIHAPLTIALFVLVAFHVADVFGLTAVGDAGAKNAFATAKDCGACHSAIFDEWSRSAMAHAQTSQIMLSQLPVTLAENKKLAQLPATRAANRRLAAKLGITEQQLLDAHAKICINCHAPVGSKFANPDSLLPFNESGAGGEPAVTGGNAAVQSDGVGCITCHTQAHAPATNSGNTGLDIGKSTSTGYGTVYGPLFDDPGPLPVVKHDAAHGDLFSDPVASSQLCGACHNVEVDLNGDGRSNDKANDLVLQTTFDEWSTYAKAGGSTPPGASVPRVLGCSDCHMPALNGKRSAVSFAPGVLSAPRRSATTHDFVGVDYDLSKGAYSTSQLNEVLADRKALLQSAVTLEVGQALPGAGSTATSSVTVRNNGLGHNFPTGFAFARQFWLEVSAHTTSGDVVPLATPPGFTSVPAVSGAIPDAQAELPQCDPAAVARAQGKDPQKVPNGNIRFAAAFAPGKCDPWLVNFQAILTDGDPRNTGTFHEVPYQSVLPGIVKQRARIATPTTVKPIRPPGVPADPDDGTTVPELESFPYTFDTSHVAPGQQIVVTAKLRLRHLPPEFVRTLMRQLGKLPDVPESARASVSDLLRRLVVTDVVQAQSGQAPRLACAGAQNGGSILRCVATAAKK